MSELVNKDGHENDYQPLDQQRRVRDPAVSQQRADEQKRRINFYRYSEDFHFKLLRSILPRSFFGRLSTKTMRRGYLCIARRDLTNSWIARARPSLPRQPPKTTTKVCVFLSPFTPKTPRTAHSKMAWCPNKLFSPGVVETKPPLTFTTSSARPPYQK